MAALFLLSACQAYFDPAGAIRKQVRDAGWHEATIKEGGVDLAVFHRPIPKTGNSASALHIYIEGDGDAFTARGRPTDDPTPLDPVALNMAMQDPSPLVAYLGRPCQYAEGTDTRGCDRRMWSSHRFSESAVASMDRAISRLKKGYGAERLVLFGFSGGGAIAALIAARRDDVEALVTVAGTLDHAAWTKMHLVHPLSGSLNPKDVAPRIGQLPQTHFVGGKDRIMPREIAQSFIRALSPGHRAKVVEVPGFGHECCWARDWPGLLAGTATK